LNHPRIARPIVLMLALSAVAAGATAQVVPPQTDLSAATIEDLMKILVTTTSHTPEGLAGAAARVQVVTAAQIERRGDTTRRVSVGFSLRAR
jgi:outer membrane cobalamin receptor